MKTISTIIEEFDAGCNTDNISDPPSDKRWIKSFISQAINQAREEERDRINKILKSRLQYCQEQNGKDYCKNCGLNSDDLSTNIKE